MHLVHTSTRAILQSCKGSNQALSLPLCSSTMLTLGFYYYYYYYYYYYIFKFYLLIYLYSTLIRSKVGWSDNQIQECSILSKIRKKTKKIKCLRYLLAIIPKEETLWPQGYLAPLSGVGLYGAPWPFGLGIRVWVTRGKEKSG